MSWKEINQLTLADGLINEHKALQELDDVHQIIDWSPIAAQLEHIHTKRRGEKAFPPLLMFKALLLQSWYGLSDAELEKQLARDLLFRRFVGLGVSHSVPDHSTIWRFRALLEQESLLSRIFEEINAQLSQRGLFIKAGEISILDASVIQAQRHRPGKGKGGRNTQDQEAGYSVKAGSDGVLKTVYGYKAHMNVDEDGFIKRVQMTPGNRHDSQCFEELLTGTESQVYADSAYASERTNELLKQRGVQNCVLARAYRNTPLTPAQKQKNRQYSSIRCTVERVFGILKLHHGMGKARYLGLTRNRARLHLMCMAQNIKRGVSLLKEMLLISKDREVASII